MQCRAGQIVAIIDLKQRPLGSVEVQSVQGDLVCGRFCPQAAFSEVATLFVAFEEAVADQALSVVDRLDAAIAALGLQMQWPQSDALEPIHDVQIFADGAFSCRTTAPPTGLYFHTITDTTLTNDANNVFNGINESGDIN